MTISIQKTRKGRATITVDGVTYHAAFDTTARRWVVDTPSGRLTSTSPKLKSIAALFGPQVSVNGASAPRRSSAPRTPRAPRPASATPRRGRRKGGPAFTTAAPDAYGLTLAALVAIEAALVANAAKRGVTPALEKHFERYQKVKALALNNPNANEQQVALRTSLIEAVKLVF